MLLLALVMVSLFYSIYKGAFLGNSHITRWYQYGFFDEPQGPITPKPNGVHVREVAEWLIKRVGASLGDDELDSSTQLEIDPSKSKSSDNSHLDFVETDLIVIMARKWNRLILNERELAIHLSKKFGYQTQFLHNENQSFEEQIKLLRRARIVLAMHGSILIMGIFCRRGTVIIEMYK
jgi:protein O-mannose beta-1,4-N-acetylglucosaminyltransferase